MSSSFLSSLQEITYSPALSSNSDLSCTFSLGEVCLSIAECSTKPVAHHDLKNGCLRGHVTFHAFNLRRPLDMMCNRRMQEA
jgi:hypothetical protein